VTQAVRNPATSWEYKTRCIENKYKKIIRRGCLQWHMHSGCIGQCAVCLYEVFSNTEVWNTHCFGCAHTVLRLGREGNANARFNKHSTAEFTKKYFPTTQIGSLKYLLVIFPSFNFIFCTKFVSYVQILCTRNLSHVASKARIISCTQLFI